MISFLWKSTGPLGQGTMDMCSGKGILAVGINVEAQISPHFDAWVKAISSAQITSVSVTTATPTYLTSSCT